MYVSKEGHHWFRWWLVTDAEPGQYFNSDLLLTGPFWTNSAYFDLQFNSFHWKWASLCSGLEILLYCWGNTNEMLLPQGKALSFPVWVLQYSMEAVQLSTLKHIAQGHLIPLRCVILESLLHGVKTTKGISCWSAIKHIWFINQDWMSKYESGCELYVQFSECKGKF